LSIAYALCYNLIEVINMGELTNRERVGTSLPIALAKQLKEYSKTSMIPISRIIEAALVEYLQRRC